VLIHTLANPKLAVVIKAMTKGVGLDFIKEIAAPARHPQIRTTGTKLLLRMLARFPTLALSPASGLFPIARASGPQNMRAVANTKNDRVSGFGFISFSPFLNEWVE
jgi:hypothetical protein